MVKGLDLFRSRFAAHADGFVLIGGAACHEWFAREALSFRATKDLDIVLLLEALNASFVAALRQFVADGGYTLKERSSGAPELYRFSKPQNDAYPYMLELFSRQPDGVALWEDQTIVPIPVDEAAASLSAILLDEAYYGLIRGHVDAREGLPIAAASALIPLKARAWLDLTKRKAAGDRVDQKDIAKHRTDVFRLAAALPGDPGPALPDAIQTDVRQFLDAFPEGSGEWPGILDALKTTFGNQRFKPAELRGAIQDFYRLDRG